MYDTLSGLILVDLLEYRWAAPIAVVFRPFRAGSDFRKTSPEKV